MVKKKYRVKINKKDPSQRVSPRRAGNQRVKRSRMRRNLTQKIGWVLGKVFLLAAVFGVFYLGYLFFLQSKCFTIKEYVITGNQYARTHEIRKIAEAEGPMNVFLIKFSDLEEKLKTLKWIDRISIKSEIPDILVIRVKEKIPIALGVYKNELYLIDNRGERIDQFIPDYASFHLPVINGLGDSEDAHYRTRMLQGLEVARLLMDPEIQLLEDISEIDISASHNILLLQEREKQVLLAKVMLLHVHQGVEPGPDVVQQVSRIRILLLLAQLRE